MKTSLSIFAAATLLVVLGFGDDQIKEEAESVVLPKKLATKLAAIIEESEAKDIKLSLHDENAPLVRLKIQTERTSDARLVKQFVDLLNGVRQPEPSRPSREEIKKFMRRISDAPIETEKL